MIHCYWLKRDEEGGFPEDFYRAMAERGWLGIAMPEAYDSGLGLMQAAIMMQAVAESGAAMSGASAIHMNIFGLYKTIKVWISTAQVANKMLIFNSNDAFGRSPKSHRMFLTLFYTDLDWRYVKVKEIEKMGRKAVDSNEVFIDHLPVPVFEHWRGRPRLYYILDGMNPKRILIAAQAIGIGKAALQKAVQYAKDRIVFDRPIGTNQGIQHPLTRCRAQLELANRMTF